MTDGATDRSADIGKAAGKGLGWSLLGTIGTKPLTFAVGIVLARLLSPADFGTYAIAAAACMLVMHINDVGLIAAVVQWRGKLSEVAPTATTLAALFSLVVYGIFWLIAPGFARLAGDPAATPVVRLLTVIVIIDGLTAVRSAALMRRFQQSRLTIANAIGLVASSATAVSMAFAGGGAYAFVAGQIVGTTVGGVLVVILAKVPFGFRVDRKVARHLIRFGAPLAASLGVEAILTNADYVIAGRILGVVAVGYYLLAFNVSGWLQGMVGTAIRYVSVAAFSRLSDDNTEELSRGVQRSVPILVSVLMPTVALMVVLAPQVVTVVYGDKWLPAVIALRFLMILSGVRLLTGLALDILTGAGKPRYTLWVNVAWAVALIPALIIGTRTDGIRGTAIAHAIVGVCVALPLAAVALHRVGIHLRTIPRDLIRPIMAAIVCAVVALVAVRFAGPHPFVQLSVAGTLGLVAYAVVCTTAQQRRQAWAIVRRRTAPSSPSAPAAATTPADDAFYRADTLYRLDGYGVYRSNAYRQDVDEEVPKARGLVKMGSETKDEPSANKQHDIGVGRHRPPRSASGQPVR